MDFISFCEISGFISTLICVWLNRLENIWGWLFAIIASAFYFVLFYELKLFGDMLLQLFFIIISIYGWYEWRFGLKGEKSIEISWLPKKLLPALLLIFITSYISFSFLLHQLGSDVVLLDAFCTIVSLIAQWMMAKKYIENWLLWIGVNIISVIMYSYKEAYLTSFLYFLLLIMAINAYFVWKHRIHAQ